MEAFYHIAGLTVQMDSFGRTVHQAVPYKIDKAEDVDIVVASYWPDQKSKHPELSDDDGEYMGTASDFYKKLLSFDGIMLHASAVVVEGKAYLFSADSGTGKSTHTALWMEKFGSDAFILNDDKPALRREANGWIAYGTPWSGKHDISRNVGVPVAGIALLQRGDENVISRCNDASVIGTLLRQVNKPKDPASRIKVLELIDMIIREIPIWRLSCNRELEAVEVAYSAMSNPLGTTNEVSDIC